jgi:hypothetical protein
VSSPVVAAPEGGAGVEATGGAGVDATGAAGVGGSGGAGVTGWTVVVVVGLAVGLTGEGFAFVCAGVLRGALRFAALHRGAPGFGCLTRREGGHAGRRVFRVLDTT